MQNVTPIALSSAEKSVTVQTHTQKQTVNDISIHLAYRHLWIINLDFCNVTCVRNRSVLTQYEFTVYSKLHSQNTQSNDQSINQSINLLFIALAIFGISLRQYGVFFYRFLKKCRVYERHTRDRHMTKRKTKITRLDNIRSFWSISVAFGNYQHRF